MNITFTGYYDQLLEAYQCTSSLSFVTVAVFISCSELLPLAQSLLGKHDEDGDIAEGDDDDDHSLFRNIAVAEEEDQDLWRDLGNRLSNSSGVLHGLTQVVRSRAFGRALFDVNPALVSLRAQLLGFRVHKHVKRRRRGRKTETTDFEERASSYGSSSTTSSTDQFDSAASSSDSPSSSGSD